MDMPDDWLRELRSWAKDNGNVRELWLFGSRAQGCARPDSDVDLAIAFMPDTGAGSSPLANFGALRSTWRARLKEIVGRHVSFEGMVPGAADPDWDSMVRCFGIRLWSRDESSSRPMPLLILKPAGGDAYDVLAADDGAVVGRITLGSAPTRERAKGEAMAAFAKSWRHE
jgi:predicted nucleotidyltransferase